MLRRRFRLTALVAAVLGALTFAACAAPPDKEIQQAQGAIDAAKAVGADQYAAEEFAAAQTALKNANDAVDQRDYRLALNHALDARDRAKTAAREAADRRATARVEADRALAAATRLLDDAQARIKSPDTARLNARALQEARRSLNAADRSVQKARTSFDRGDYRETIDGARAATESLQAFKRTLDAAPTSGVRRRR